MSMFFGRVGSSRAVCAALSWIALVMLFSLAVPAHAQPTPETWGDLGDAPDTTNHDGENMNAYPKNSGALAHYPTVFDPTQPGPRGPWHRFPAARSWLGGNVSREKNADRGPYEDPFLNMLASGSYANADRRDDSLGSNVISLPDCGETSFTYRVTGAPGIDPHTDYVNVFIDLNRNGIWGDTVTCTAANNESVMVKEWAVKNQQVEVAAGANIIVTPMFYSKHPNDIGPDGHLWMRITLSDVALPPGSDDGRGLFHGFDYGETEDHLLMNVVSSEALRQTETTPSSDYVPDVAYYRSY